MHRLSLKLLCAICALLSTGCFPSPASEEIPAPRSGFGFAFDEARGELVLFGGSDSSNVRLGDTWTWSNGHWTHHDVEGPSPRSDLFVAYDAARAQTVVFGGLSEDGLRNDTWVWDGSKWFMADTTGPSVRQLGTMAYDAVRERIVLFGGSGPDRARLGDTWVWDGERWTEALTDTAPSPRGAHQMAYDEKVGQVALTGGWDGTSVADLWHWDGASWTLTDSMSTPPRLHGSMVYDRSIEGLVLFGGFGETGRENSIWAFRNDSWSALSPESASPDIRAEHDGVYHPDLGFVTFGGIVGDGMALADRQKSNELWAFRDGVWTRH